MAMKTPWKMLLKYRYGIIVILCLSCVLLVTFSPVSKTLRCINALLEDEPSVCVPKKRIAFVKVHKAASTTVTSILQRYGMYNDLTFALPNKDFYHIGFFETINPINLSPISKAQTYDIVCQHVVYNEEAFAKYLPSDITVIAAVREPLQRFVSSFQFFQEYRQTLKSLSKLKVNANDTELMREFLRNPEYYEPKVFKAGSLAVNRMSFDLGIPKEQFNNPAFVEEYIKMLDRNLELVLVAEHFDESLVILKRRMCWSTKDILYKTKHKGHRAKPVIPDDIIKRVKELSPSDYQIYEYFSKKFEKMAAVEVDLKAEVELFQQINHNVTQFCNQWRIANSAFLTIDKTPFSEGFNFTKTDCYFMITEEVKYVRLLQHKQVSAARHQNENFQSV